MSAEKRSQSESLVPRAPPIPPVERAETTSASCSAGNGNDLEQVAENLEHEVKYLIEPLHSLAGEHKGPVFTLVYDVKPVIQQGPMCGLVSLSVASQLLSGETFPPNHLLAQAKEKGYTKQGEMFSAKNLLDLARSSLNCSGMLLNRYAIETKDILMAIAEQKALVMAYDSDKDHSPCLAKGHKAHWCTLVGFAVISVPAPSSLNMHATHVSMTPIEAQHFLNHELKNVDSCFTYLFARQGKSRHMGLWEYTRLMESNSNLSEAGPHRSPNDYVIPSEGISNSLSSVIICLN